MNYFNISWYSKKDGPGTRTVLFLQGCNLHCAWCHSPQSQPKYPPVLYYEEYCNHCGKCIAACKEKCHDKINEKHVFNRDNCTLCRKCVEACPNRALDYRCVEETVDEVFYRLENELELLKGIGGLTVSGGEPMLWSKEIKELLVKCKERGIHTAIETSAAVPTERFISLDNLVDVWLFGLKQTIPKLSMKMTGINMELVEENLRYLSQKAKPSRIIIRYPCIGGYTDQMENVKRITELMQKNSLHELQLLPYNLFTDYYYKASGREFDSDGFYRPDEKSIEMIKEYFEENGISCTIVS